MTYRAAPGISRPVISNFAILPVREQTDGASSSCISSLFRRVVEDCTTSMATDYIFLYMTDTESPKNIYGNMGVR